VSSRRRVAATTGAAFGLTLVALDVAVGAAATDLLGTPSERWEVVVSCERGGSRFVGVTGAPVHARPPAASTG
jgi:hypothetical protein